MAWTILEKIPAISSLFFFFFRMWHLQKNEPQLFMQNNNFGANPIQGAKRWHR